MTDFWARRKAAVEAEEQADVQATQARAVETERDALAEKTDAEILADLDLPDPDLLQPGDDIRGFMAQIVPDRLRRRALRQLWKLNPDLAVLDGLVDYGEDFTDAATVIENLQTTYQVGKGMLAHVEEMARQAEAEAKADAATEAEETEPETAPLPDPVPAPVPDPVLAATDPSAPDPDPEQTEMPIPDENTSLNSSPKPRLVDPAPRRMRFTFDAPA